MENNIYSVITGTGSCIPRRKVPNQYFADHLFLDDTGRPFDKSNSETIKKFSEITGIEERRYAEDHVLTSDMAAEAAEKALTSASLDREKLDYIVVAHNFGDIGADNNRVDMVPSLASRVKHKLQVKNPRCVAYDLPFGCPGWLQGVIQCSYFLGSGDASACLVIGAETLSRVCDPHDRDSMIYSDGAGAVVMEARSSGTPAGILSHTARTDAEEQVCHLKMAPSSHPEKKDDLYLKMEGHKLYQYALTHVPGLVKESLDKAGIRFEEVDKLLIHQANEKMDRAILKRLAALYDCKEPGADIMPMTISWLGNSSVATVPTLLDLILRDQLGEHRIGPGDIIVFASVGAGMNINSVVYRWSD